MIKILEQKEEKYTIPVLLTFLKQFKEKIPRVFAVIYIRGYFISAF